MKKQINKFLLILSFTLAQKTWAQPIDHLFCVNPIKTSNIISINYFNLPSKKPSVKIWHLYSEDQKVYKKRADLGDCEKDPMAIEFALQCYVPTSTDSGFMVTLYSPGSQHLMTTIIPTSWGSSKKPITFPCP